MKKLLAVSGGIDSVVMLHLFRNDKDAVVLHFDHGIRQSSTEDCAFVKMLAEKYGLPFASKRAELGENCSEETARAARYEFFKSQISSPDDKIYTAHHQNDLLESVVINLLRGTGWRGLAPLRDANLCRPLLDWSKADIYRYATEHKLRFRLDQSNNEDKYLRNRVRQKLLDCAPEEKARMIELAKCQREIADEFDGLLEGLFSEDSRYSKAMFDGLDDDLALELLRHALKTHQGLTRPQLRRALEAIRTFESGKRFSLSKDKFLVIGRYYFSIEDNRGKLA
jgi:tRNA(Ile)-lysidine synthase